MASPSHTDAPPSSRSQVAITYYTDPLCSWSWAFEPQWRRLRYEYGDQLHWTYRMGGLIADWSTYSDPINDVSRPVQMGPQWYQARTLSGMPLNERIWFEDPPASSYPACIAVKAAERQGPDAVEQYLRRLREAVMVEGRNIARLEVLLDMADELAQAQASFDSEQFRQDLESQAVLDAFRADLKEARWREIGRFPTLILRNPDGKAIITVGYRPYGVLLDAVTHVAPNISPQRPLDDLIGYVAHWERLTTRELAEVSNEPQGIAQVLEVAAATGHLTKEEIPGVHQSFWRTATHVSERA